MSQSDEETETDEEQVGELGPEAAEESDDDEEPVQDDFELDLHVPAELPLIGFMSLDRGYTQAVARDFAAREQTWKRVNGNRPLPNRVYEQLDQEARLACAPTGRSSRSRAPSRRVLQTAMQDSDSD